MTFPAELTALRQWVCWRYETRKSKRTKVPYAVTGAPASTTNPATWASYDEATAALEASLGTARPYDGTGFVFSPDDPFCGIDLDHIDRSEEDALRAAELVDTLGSYAESSPSGAGVHIYVRATLPPDSPRRAGFVECYDAGRYFTVTGDQTLGTPATIADWDGAALSKLLFPNGGTRRVTLTPYRPPAPSSGPPIDDRDLLDMAMRAKNGGKVGDLWQGGFGGHVSHSEADAALCAHLAFWTNRDDARIDALFRKSALMRPKWDERRGAMTYGERTIRRAIALVTAGFEPPARSA